MCDRLVSCVGRYLNTCRLWLSRQSRLRTRQFFGPRKTTMPRLPAHGSHRHRHHRRHELQCEYTVPFPRLPSPLPPPPIIALEEESTFQRTTSPTRPPVAAAKVTFQEERPCLSLVWILEAKGKDSLSVMNHTIYVEQDGISRSVRCQWKMVTGKGQSSGQYDTFRSQF